MANRHLKDYDMPRPLGPAEPRQVPESERKETGWSLLKDHPGYEGREVAGKQEVRKTEIMA